ncbi:MAG: FtsX-like permease family protein [Phycisphaerales bacterium]|nr:FtsX-like permease family protein [Phycisphaerales bacterium]
MTALHTKLLRDLARMWTQLLAAALVMACGVGMLTMAVSTHSSLAAARDRYYERYRFPDVFAHLKRAPAHLRDRLAEIPGVARVVTRVVAEVNLDVPDLPEPAIGRLISVPDRPPYGLGELHLRRGRLPEPGHDSEVVASEGFAEAHGFGPGATVNAVINGRLRKLTIVGIGLSPEYVYQVRPGDALPDDRRYGVFWMLYRELAPAFDMDGAFNDIAIALTPGATEAAVIARTDRLTEPYGGQGAYGVREQTSDQFLRNELDQLRIMSIFPPTVFMSATAFILNIVFSRLVRTQREQVAALKAFGYTSAAIAVHYLQMALLVAAIGSALGVLIGWLLGLHLTGMYTRFYRFPAFAFTLDPRAVLLAISAASGAAILGTLGAVGRAAALPPAQAMRPEAPADYRRTVVERLGVQRAFGPSGRMVLRHLERQPVRALLSLTGISLAAAVLVVGGFMQGSIDYLMDFMFFTTQRQDMTITFTNPASPSAADEAARLPGVLATETFRAIPARIRAGPRSRLQGVIGLPAEPALNRVVDERGRPVRMPGEGVLLSAILADLLGVRAGDTVTLEVLEGQRPVTTIPVAAVVQSYIGTAAYMDAAALNRLLREGPVISGAYLRVDPAASGALYATLKQTPAVASVTVKQAALQSFRDTIAGNILQMRLFNVIFAGIIAFGVIYNSARVSFAERAHELATLRILGFRRAEASGILLGELAVLTILAIPPGLLLGRTLAHILSNIMGGETIRIPAVVTPASYAFAVTVIIAAAIISGLVVRRAVDTLNLVEVLKTKG